MDFNKSNLVVVDLHIALSEILKENNCFVCNLINNKYYYTFDNWFSGKKQVFTIAHFLAKWGNIVHQMKKNGRPKEEMDKLLSINVFLK